ncbi:MAG: DNA methyltransferase, partial [Thermomicrobiales bacterium]
KGNESPLPPEIAVGISDISNRGGWNRPATAEYALPTETWREHVARRQRHNDVWNRIVDGEISEISDLITYNLDIRRFAEDVIRHAEGPEVVRAFYKAITKISVLDPTCGSGAFLFAALNILEPLYEACLDRMEGFLDGLVLETPKPHPEKFRDFRETLAQAEAHPNRTYFTLKQIVLNNLYGVDIVEEAVEICKLRLFLKLVAQLESKNQIEPLPDIDFNIRCGNTLVGFARRQEVEKSLIKGRQRSLDLDGEVTNQLEEIDEAAKKTDLAFQRFHEMQSQQGMDADGFRLGKEELRRRLNELGTKLNAYLARDYTVTAKSGDPLYEQWLASHQPFHWFAEFYGIMRSGGFNVIVGNPPFVEYSKVRKVYSVNNLATISAGNLYAYVIERCSDLIGTGGFIGMVAQLSAFCTPRMEPFLNHWLHKMAMTWVPTFDDRPGKLFDGLQHIRVALPIGKAGSKECKIFTTKYQKFATSQRTTLFESLSYCQNLVPPRTGSLLKISSELENHMASRLWTNQQVLGDQLTEQQNANFVYYGYGFGYWGKILNFKSFFRGERVSSSTGDKYIYCRPSCDRDIVVAVMNSSLFYWFYSTFSDGHNFTKHSITSFPFSAPSLSIASRLKSLTQELMDDLKRNSRRRSAYYKATGAVEYDGFYPRESKVIIDRIDEVLSDHYGLSGEELDFITNYDIKYRMGADLPADESL